MALPAFLCKHFLTTHTRCERVHPVNTAETNGRDFSENLKVKISKADRAALERIAAANDRSVSAEVRRGIKMLIAAESAA